MVANVVADTYVTSREPGDTHGERSYSYANTDESVGLLSFATRGLVPSDARVTGAVLRLYVLENHQESGWPVVSRRALDWTENGVSLDNFTSGRSTDDVSRPVKASAGQWVSIPIDPSVVSTTSRTGLQVRYSRSDSTFRYATKESGNAPQLVISTAPAQTLPPMAQPAPAPAPTTAPQPPAATTTGVPEQARSAGFSSLQWSDEFADLSRIDLTGRGVPGHSWYTDRPFGQNLNPSDLRVDNGVLHLNQTSAPESIALSSVSRNTGTGQTFQYGYFEIRMKFNEADAVRSVGFPSLYMVPRGRVNGTATAQWPELDVFEAYHGNYEASPHWFVGSVHDWFDDQGRHVMNSGNNIYKLPPSADLSQFHTYALSWSKGTLIWYFDGQEVLRQTYGEGKSPVPNHYDLPNGSFSMLDRQTEGMALLLGTGVNYPAQVDWIRVWH